MSIEERDELIILLDRHIRRISKEVCEEHDSQGQLPPNPLPADPEARRIRNAIQQIQAKEFISAKEAALLLNCSERHIHNLVDRARRGLSEHPIPYRKIGETTSFLRAELIEWTKGDSSSAGLRLAS